MSTYSNNLLVLESGITVKMAAADTISLANFDVTGTADFTGSTVTGITVQSITDGTGTLTIGSSGALSTTGITSMDLDCSGALSLNSSGGVIAIGNDSVSQNISIGTGGTRTVSLGSATATINMNMSGGASTWTIKTTTAAALAFTNGSTVYQNFNTQAGIINYGVATVLAEGTDSSTTPQAVFGTAGATIAVGDVLTYAATSGKLVLADANGTGTLKNPTGTCRVASTDTNPTALAMAGLVPVTFAAAPAAASIGAIVYLSETAGRGTLTAPSTSGSRVYMLGILASADGAATTCRVLWQPQFISDIA